MSSQSQTIENDQSIVADIIWWFITAVFSTVGMVNVFWGNDTVFGIFVICLSFIYLPPLNLIFRKKVGFSIPLLVKVILGIFLLWAALGVGEFFDKIDLMLMDFQVIRN